MKNFRATHILRHHGLVEPVMLCDGGLYARAEWNACDAADYTLEPDGSVLFQGQPFDGSLTAIRYALMGHWRNGPGNSFSICLGTYKSMSSARRAMKRAEAALEPGGWLTIRDLSESRGS